MGSGSSRNKYVAKENPKAVSDEASSSAASDAELRTKQDDSEEPRRASKRSSRSVSDEAGPSENLRKSSKELRRSSKERHQPASSANVENVSTEMIMRQGEADPNKGDLEEQRRGSKKSSRGVSDETGPPDNLRKSSKERWQKAVSMVNNNLTNSDELDEPRRGSKKSVSNVNTDHTKVDELDEPRRGSKKSTSSFTSGAYDPAELLALYPEEEYEVTGYADLGGLRKGMQIRLDDFEKKKTLNGLIGTCDKCDSEKRVWIVKFEDERLMRVIPLSFMPKEKPKEGQVASYFKGLLLYGSTIVDFNVHHEILEHRRLVWERGPQKELPFEKIIEPVPLEGGLKVGDNVKIISGPLATIYNEGGTITGAGDKVGMAKVQFADGIVRNMAIDNLRKQARSASKVKPLRRSSTVELKRRHSIV